MSATPLSYRNGRTALALASNPIPPPRRQTVATVGIATTDTRAAGARPSAKPAGSTIGTGALAVSAAATAKAAAFGSVEHRMRLETPQRVCMR